MMLLAIDIGNTNISFGLFRQDKIIRKFDIPTKSYSSKRFKALLANAKITDTVICGVVPKVTKVLEIDLKKALGKAPYIIGKDIIIPVKNLYRKPAQVGQDRLVNAYAGIALYGAPLVVVDFGTAITFDVVSENKEYLGGMILPGLETSLACLAEKTALLPKISLSKPKEFIGKDTETSMLSGIVYGFACLTDKMTEKIQKEIGKNAKIICTGGASGIIAPYCRCFDAVDKNLTLKGLSLIYKKIIWCQ